MKLTHTTYKKAPDQHLICSVSKHPCNVTKAEMFWFSTTMVGDPMYEESGEGSSEKHWTEWLLHLNICGCPLISAFAVHLFTWLFISDSVHACFLWEYSLLVLLKKPIPLRNTSIFGYKNPWIETDSWTDSWCPGSQAVRAPCKSSEVKGRLETGHLSIITLSLFSVLFSYHTCTILTTLCL